MNDELILVQNLIHEIRGQKVMLDFDLARLYQVKTGELNQSVKRNIKRFPPDFMFQLTPEEVKMMSQIVISSKRKASAPPFAFTEQGVAMLSGLLKSDVAIAANIAIMRAFVQVREYLLAASSLSAEVKELRAKVDLLALQREDDLGAVNDLSDGGKEGRTPEENRFPAKYGGLICHSERSEESILFSVPSPGWSGRP